MSAWLNGQRPSGRISALKDTLRAQTPIVQWFSTGVRGGPKGATGPLAGGHEKHLGPTVGPIPKMFCMYSADPWAAYLFYYV